MFFIQILGLHGPIFMIYKVLSICVLREGSTSFRQKRCLFTMPLGIHKCTTRILHSLIWLKMLYKPSAHKTDKTSPCSLGFKKCLLEEYLLSCTALLENIPLLELLHWVYLSFCQKLPDTEWFIIVLIFIHTQHLMLPYHECISS